MTNIYNIEKMNSHPDVKGLRQRAPRISQNGGTHFFFDDKSGRALINVYRVDDNNHLIDKFWASEQGEEIERVLDEIIDALKGQYEKEGKWQWGDRAQWDAYEMAGDYIINRKCGCERRMRGGADYCWLHG